MLSNTCTAALSVGRSTRALRTSSRLLANTPSHPDLSTPYGKGSPAAADVKPTAWAARKVQGKSVPVWPWFAVLATLGSAAAYRYLYLPSDAPENASFRNGTLPPSEIGAKNPEKAPVASTYVGIEKK